jgi:hypothetical protein
MSYPSMLPLEDQLLGRKGWPYEGIKWDNSLRAIAISSGLLFTIANCLILSMPMGYNYLPLYDIHTIFSLFSNQLFFKMAKMPLSSKLSLSPQSIDIRRRSPSAAHSCASVPCTRVTVAHHPLLHHALGSLMHVVVWCPPSTHQHVATSHHLLVRAAAHGLIMQPATACRPPLQASLRCARLPFERMC